MNAAATFEILCCSPAPQAAIAKMGDDTLAALVLWLDAGGSKGGEDFSVPFLVHTYAEAEIIRRWTEDHAPQVGAVGEGAL